jgi:hypothetical protein
MTKQELSLEKLNPFIFASGFLCGIFILILIYKKWNSGQEDKNESYQTDENSQIEENPEDKLDRDIEEIVIEKIKFLQDSIALLANKRADQPSPSPTAPIEDNNLKKRFNHPQL